MDAATALSEAVSVRYAREQYAIGYLHGVHDTSFGHAEALEFARFYVTRCERAGRLVDVQDSYRQWRWGKPVQEQLPLFG
jgi:hypothetical protein